MKSISDIYQYKAVVWDLDGTLYFQKKLRFIMACELLKYYLSHPSRIRELLAIKRFRKIREKWEEIAPGSETRAALGSELQAASEDGTEEKPVSLEDAQYEYTASVLGMKSEDVKRAVEQWMYEKPLQFLRSCRDEKAAELFSGLKQKGIPCYIFSDYPIEDKLKALELFSDGNYAATDPKVSALKPDPKGLLLILSEHSLEPSEVLMIGDRDSRDGEAARRAGCDYVILSRSKKKRNIQYNL
ncbi:MAG: HAD family hydrolase [Lachnospiraceae bacterium]|nr:HAD family hydrolase [Lachnospiraceae bacterium]